MKTVSPVVNDFWNGRKAQTEVFLEPCRDDRTIISRVPTAIKGSTYVPSFGRVLTSVNELVKMKEILIEVISPQFLWRIIKSLPRT